MGYGLRVMGYGLWEDALMDVQCSYNPPTIPRLWFDSTPRSATSASTGMPHG